VSLCRGRENLFESENFTELIDVKTILKTFFFLKKNLKFNIHIIHIIHQVHQVHQVHLPSEVFTSWRQFMGLMQTEKAKLEHGVLAQNVSLWHHVAPCGTWEKGEIALT
jgi:hypothetical protein